MPSEEPSCCTPGSSDLMQVAPPWPPQKNAAVGPLGGAVKVMCLGGAWRFSQGNKNLLTKGPKISWRVLSFGQVAFFPGLR